MLYPSRTGTVADLLAEARSQVTLSSPTVRLRLLDIVSHKIVGVNEPDTRIDSLPGTQSKSYRVEEVPEDQLQLGDSDMLVPVAHFHKEIYSTFGHPFLLKLSEGERFESVKEKIQKHLGVPDKEFEKYRIGVISMGRAKYLEDMQTDTVRIREFLHQGQSGNNAKPYIGLEHVNKHSKRARYNYMEKAIKIYN
jgi:ubiquitin carboxyl-terminal hydrolase 7